MNPLTITTSIDGGAIVRDIVAHLPNTYYEPTDAVAALDVIVERIRTAADPVAALLAIKSEAAGYPSGAVEAEEVAMRRISAALAGTPDPVTDVIAFEVERLDGDEGMRGVIIAGIAGDELLVGAAAYGRGGLGRTIAALDVINAVDTAALSVRWETWHNTAGLVDLLQTPVPDLARTLLAR